MGGYHEKIRGKITYSLPHGFLACGFVGCKKEGTAEKAGKKIDQAIDSAKKQVEEATK